MTTKIFWGGKVIRKEDGLILTAPLNEWDMNYHLYDEKENKEYVIDIGDVEEGDTLEFMKECAYKIYSMEDEEQ